MRRHGRALRRLFTVLFVPLVVLAAAPWPLHVRMWAAGAWFLVAGLVVVPRTPRAADSRRLHIDWRTGRRSYQRRAR